MALQQEFSRPIAVDRLPKSGKFLFVEATEEELKKLADRFDLVNLLALTAEIGIKPTYGTADYKVEGTFKAEYVQKCIVSLLPIHQSTSGEFIRLYKVGETAYDEHELIVDLDETDPPDLIPTRMIDLGELVAEEFGLTIDLFPRAVGANFDEVKENDDESAPLKADNPFAALEELRDKWRK